MPLTNPWPLAGDTDYVIKTQAVITEIETALDAVGGMTEWTAADAAGPASLDFHEDTDNGTNKITLVAPAALGSDFTLVLPAASDTLVGKATSDTFTNKTFNANGTGNSLTNVEVADFASGVVDTDLSSVSGSHDTLASAKAIKTALDLKAPLASPVLTGTPTIPSFASAGHNHTNAAGGGQLTDAALSAAVGIAKGGTGQTTAQNARNALLPTQSGSTSKVLITDGTDVSWGSPAALKPRVNSARRYSQRSLYGGGFTGMNLGPNAVFAVPIPITKAVTISGISAKVNTNAGSSAILGLYADDGPEGPGTLLASGTINPSTTGVKTASISQAIATPRLVWGAIVCDSNSTVWAALSAATEYLGSDSSLAPAYILSKAVGSLTMPSTFPTTPDYWDGGGSGQSPLIYMLIS